MNKYSLLLIFVLSFFASALTFYFIRLHSGKIPEVRFSPFLLYVDFNLHYKYIWMYDTVGALLLGLLLEKRWLCRNACYMGTLCSIGSTYSRLLPVINSQKCNHCGVCDKVCPVNIPVESYLEKSLGLITNSECLLCGKCIDQCKKEAIRYKMIWNRKRYKKNIIIKSESMKSL